MKRSLLAVASGVLIVGSPALAADLPLYPFDFEGEDIRIGWTAGGGVEWALFDNWSAKLEYDFYDFGTRSIQLTDNSSGLSGPVQVKQSVQAVKLGLNFHIWSFDR